MLDQQTRTAIKLSGKELLRVYWYDGVMAGGLTPQQRAMSELPDVNFRGGLVNSKGQQKGVDSLIVMDLFELASNRAVTDAALVTGDSDLAIGIDLAQKKGVRIAVLGIEDLTVGVLHGQSREITDRADRVHRFGSAELAEIRAHCGNDDHHAHRNRPHQHIGRARRRATSRRAHGAAHGAHCAAEVSN